ncbi:hypothetical protein [Vagococcus xieshaowenii]|uniref:Uncharacterized protein n=1 Tax=Vagococcus xieshaowenii TaxID=2562451 RepID=A0AAJ5JMF6_9ENTE|nr:hypothetical protein [Vagococcus xieshaowenii]QCA28233.1 hypothetical protein E4Z98_02470 [Vagococcus xieshaowenii]TFZ41888.1 hypothetical protein E4031_04650 [Vagococcus xieshaowenii]
MNSKVIERDVERLQMKLVKYEMRVEGILKRKYYMENQFEKDSAGLKKILADAEKDVEDTKRLISKLEKRAQE